MGTAGPAVAECNNSEVIRAKEKKENERKKRKTDGDRRSPSSV
jgi:hypothetical protein